MDGGSAERVKGRTDLVVRSAAAGAAVAFTMLSWTMATPPSRGTMLAVVPAAAAEAVHRTAGSVAPVATALAPTISPLLADATTSVVAHGALPVVPVYASPDDPSPAFRLDHPTANGQPLVLLVVAAGDDGWLEVLLPVRPNGTSGWVRAGHVTLHHHRFGVVVDLGNRTLVVYEGGNRRLAFPIAIGVRDTPTPGGRFYIKELLAPPDPTTVYGRYAFGLSGFSNALDSFAGGTGVIGIHGTNDPASIGREVSAGCIRLHNDDVGALVGLLPLGTPVEIRA